MDQPFDTVSKAIVEADPLGVTRLLLGWIGLPARVHRAVPDRTELARVAEPLDNLLRLELGGPGASRRAWLLLEVMAEWKTGYEKTVRAHWEDARRGRKPSLPVVLVLRKGHGRTTMRPRESIESRALGVTVETFRFFVVKLWEIAADELLSRGPIVALPFLPFARGASEATIQAGFARLRQSKGTSRNDMLLGLAINSSHVFRRHDWLATIPMEIRMKSTAYEQILAEGRAEGRASGRAEGALEAKRAMVARAVKARLGPRRAGPLVARAGSASEAKLDRANDLLAATRDDARLLAALEKLLPPARRVSKRRK